MASKGETQAFGPDIVVHEDIKALTVWAEVSSTDDTGVTIDGIKAGDVVEVSEVTGICSFDDGSVGQKISGFVAIVGGILATGLPLLGTAAALKVAKAFGDRAAALKKVVGTPGTGKRRDGYGEDPRTSDFATREGGIIVCMPSAKGVLYATEENYLAAGSRAKGRLPQYFSENVTKFNCFFPCREEDGVMSRRAAQDGSVHLIVFDSKFTDNAGDYEVKCRVIRTTPGESEDEIRSDLLRRATPNGGRGFLDDRVA